MYAAGRDGSAGKTKHIPEYKSGDCDSVTHINHRVPDWLDMRCGNRLHGIYLSKDIAGRSNAYPPTLFVSCLMTNRQDRAIMQPR